MRPRVVVIDGGRVLFDGTRAGSSRERSRPGLAGRRARRRTRACRWRTGDGRYRNIGDRPPAGAELVEPTLEDAYLLLLGDESAVVAA